jgi:hypothetical protein
MKITKITVIMKFFTKYPLHSCLYTGAASRKILPTSGGASPHVTALPGPEFLGGGHRILQVRRRMGPGDEEGLKL